MAKAIVKKSRAELIGGVSKAKKYGGGVKFRDGRYKLVVKSCCVLDTRSGPYFLAKLVPYEAVKVTVMGIKAEKLLDVEPNPVGSTVDWMQPMGLEDHPGEGNIADFICKLFCQPMPDENDTAGQAEVKDTMKQLCDLDEEMEDLPDDQKQQPGRGMVIAMETRRHETKTNKKELVLTDFESIVQTPEEKAAMIGWLDELAVGEKKTA
jgi:hypothetical protein